MELVAGSTPAYNQLEKPDLIVHELDFRMAMKTAGKPKKQG